MLGLQWRILCSLYPPPFQPRSWAIELKKICRRPWALASCLSLCRLAQATACARRRQVLVPGNGAGRTGQGWAGLPAAAPSCLPQRSSFKGTRGPRGVAMVLFSSNSCLPWQVRQAQHRLWLPEGGTLPLKTDCTKVGATCHFNKNGMRQSKIHGRPCLQHASESCCSACTDFTADVLDGWRSIAANLIVTYLVFVLPSIHTLFLISARHTQKCSAVIMSRGMVRAFIDGMRVARKAKDQLSGWWISMGRVWLTQMVQ